MTGQEAWILLNRFPAPPSTLYFYQLNKKKLTRFMAEATISLGELISIRFRCPILQWSFPSFLSILPHIGERERERDSQTHTRCKQYRKKKRNGHQYSNEGSGLWKLMTTVVLRRHKRERNKEKESWEQLEKVWADTHTHKHTLQSQSTDSQELLIHGIKGVEERSSRATNLENRGGRKWKAEKEIDNSIMAFL